MTQPPVSFQREPGSAIPLAPCGWTWFKSYKVTGEIPKTGGFGKQIDTTLDPVVKSSDLPSDFGRLSTKEDATIDKVTSRIAMVDYWVEKGLDDEWLSDKEAASIRWLLSHAEAHIEAVDETYDKWMHRDAPGEQKTSQFGPGSAGGGWPLSLGDSIIDFAGGACTGKDYNEIVEVPGHGGMWVRCPLPSEMSQRPKDRKAIKDHIMDAIINTRCAEWGVWRLKLYREALEDYKVKHGIDDYEVTPPGITPIPGMGGFKGGEVGPGAGAPGDFAAPYIPPEKPDDFLLPDPSDLPPPDDLGPEPQRVGDPFKKVMFGKPKMAVWGKGDPQRVGPRRVSGGPEGSMGAQEDGSDSAPESTSILVPAAVLAALGWLMLS